MLGCPAHSGGRWDLSKSTELNLGEMFLLANIACYDGVTLREDRTLFFASSALTMTMIGVFGDGGHTHSECLSSSCV